MSFTKILDCLAWLLGAIALGMGIVFVTASVGGLSAFLIDGNSFASMVWNFSDPKILKGMAEGPRFWRYWGLPQSSWSRQGESGRRGFRWRPGLSDPGSGPLYSPGC